MAAWRKYLITVLSLLNTHNNVLVLGKYINALLAKFKLKLKKPSFINEQVGKYYFYMLVCTYIHNVYTSKHLTKGN